MAKKYVRLIYEFEFDPGELWSHKSEFDHFLAEFFGAYQVDAEIVDFIGSPGTSLLKLTKADPLSSEPTSQPQSGVSASTPRQEIKEAAKPQTVRQQLYNAKRKIQKGT